MGHHRFRHAEGILDDPERSLAEAIHDALGVAPVLHVVEQSITRPPHPPWVAEVMGGAEAVLVRETQYRVARQAVSSHVSAVDLGWVDPRLVDELRSGHTPLRELFRRLGVRKFGVATGVAAKREDLPEPLRLAVRKGGLPMVWRSYRAGSGHQPGFLVFEALPAAAWERLILSRQALPGRAPVDVRAMGTAGGDST
jgi:hypothetical protein